MDFVQIESPIGSFRFQLPVYHLSSVQRFFWSQFQQVESTFENIKYCKMEAKSILIFVSETCLLQNILQTLSVHFGESNSHDKLDF